MFFTSLEFIGFLLITTFLYYTFGKKYQTYILLAASYYFYYKVIPVGLVYISITTISAYLVAIAMGNIQDKVDEYIVTSDRELSKKEIRVLNTEAKKKKKAVLKYGLFLNLGILVVSKYTNFVIVNINEILEKFTNMNSLSLWDLVVPLGISFYTFMTLSYLIDIYNNRYKCERKLVNLALYISFFPQMVQGPISRYNDVSETMFTYHSYDHKNALFSIQRILWGYFKKLVIADRVAIGVATIVGNPDEFTGAFVFLGMVLYAIQIYSDFTGGVDITIGIAQLYGIKLRENFMRPYFSKSIKEYWSRWHISMGTWFADYIFYPVSISPRMLSISRKARKRFGNDIGKRVPVYSCVMLVWLTTGIWHGASWNFVIWGLLNGTIILISTELEPLYAKFHSRFNVQGKFFFKVFQVCRTLLLMSSLRMLDYYRDVELSFKMFASMFTQWNGNVFIDGRLFNVGLSMGDFIITILAVSIVLLVSLLQRNGSVREELAKKPYGIRFIVWYGLILMILIFGMYGIGFESSQFIYNQF